jgi:hypothetical protein
MRVLVCGGRDCRDEDFVFSRLNAVDSVYGISFVIEGGQRTRDPKTGKFIGGVDLFASKWARTRARSTDRFDANWRAHGSAAGPMRNQRMINEGKPDLVVAFPGGRGTADMVRRAKAAGVEVIEIAARKE